MPEAVFVAAARTPIGRAGKGSLKDMRPDDLSAFIVGEALKKVPELDPTTIDDLILGCGLPGGESGYNMGRVVAVLSGLDSVPGTTVTRYCASSVRARGWPFTRSRPARATCSSPRASRPSVAVREGQQRIGLPDTMNPLVSRTRRATYRSSTEAGNASTGTTRVRTARLPGRVHRHGPDRREPRRRCKRREHAWSMDEFGARSQNLAEKAIANGFFEPARSSRSTTARRHDRQQARRRPPRRRHRRGRWPGSSRSSAPTAPVTAGNCLPAQRRRRPPWSS